MRHGIEFGLGEMLYTYFLREHDREKGRYNFYVLPDRVQLVNHLKTNDRGWKQSYFSLGTSCYLDRPVRGIFLPFGRLLVSQYLLVLVHIT